jgi:hypothetical protein
MNGVDHLGEGRSLFGAVAVDPNHWEIRESFLKGFLKSLSAIAKG